MIKHFKKVKPPKVELGNLTFENCSEYDVKKILNIPDAVRVVGLTPLGYPQKQIKELGLRKSVKDVVYHEKYGEQ